MSCRFCAVPVVLFSIFVSVFTQAHEEERKYQLTVLHTNDHHGRFWKNKKGEYGMAARYTLIQEIREKVKARGGHVLLLSGGDINTGVPESDLQNAEPDFKGMKLLGYDAMAIGNHEFDKPFTTLAQQQVWAGFPFLSANTFYAGTQVRPFKAYIEKNLNGLKVAIVGFTTSDTLKLSNQETTKLFDFRTPSDVAQKIIPKLHKKNDLVIAVTHMGHYQDGKHGSRGEGDVALAHAIPGGMLDLIVGGHTNTALHKADHQNGTYIVQAHQWGRYVGKIDFIFKNGDLHLVDYKLIPVNLQDDKDPTIIPEAPEMLDLLMPFQEKGEAKINTKIGSAADDFLMDPDREVETPLGRLVSHAIRRAVNADIGLTNDGGIRADLEKGTISYKDVLTVLPFQNDICVIEMTGKELEVYLEALPRGVPHHFHGGQGILRKDKTVKEVRIAGKLLDPNATYRIAMSNFLAKGKAGYPKLTQHPSFQNSGIQDSKALVDFIQSKKQSVPRIT